MIVIGCSDNVESILTAIYDGWEKALKVGHDNVRIIKEKDYIPMLFDEYIRIEGDNEKALKVTRSVCSQISNYAYELVYYAMLSDEDTACDDIYRFLIKGFKIGESIVRTYTDPHVLRILEIKRRVSNEACSFREFVRFNSYNNSVYISHIEPKSNIVMIVGNHFADRMPSEHWMIIDDKRKIAVVHPKNGENYIRELTEREERELLLTADMEDEFTVMWKTFFNATAIEERRNYNCQRNHFPIWKRKNVVEFK